MNVHFDKSFAKSLDKLKSRKVKTKLIEIIDELEKAASVQDVKSVKKLQGFKNFYRIRIGEYRLGFELLGDTVVLLILIAHRKDIYKKFP